MAGSSKDGGQGTVAVPSGGRVWRQPSQGGRTRRAARVERWAALHDQLEAGLIAALGPEHVIRNGPTQSELRLPQTLNLGFPGLDGDSLLMQLDLGGIAASVGSALCEWFDATLSNPAGHARSRRPLAIVGSVQLRRTTSEAEIDEAVARITKAVCSITVYNQESPARSVNLTKGLWKT